MSMVVNFTHGWRVVLSWVPHAVLSSNHFTLLLVSGDKPPLILHICDGESLSFTELTQSVVSAHCLYFPGASSFRY